MMKKIWLLGALLFLIISAIILNSFVTKKQNIKNASQIVHQIGGLYDDKNELSIEDVSRIQKLLDDIDNLAYFGLYKYPEELKDDEIKLVEVEELEKVMGTGLRHSGNNNKFYVYETENWLFEWKLQD